VGRRNFSEPCIGLRKEPEKEIHLSFPNMATDPANHWTNLSLSEGEDNEMEIQVTDVKKAVQRGRNCVIGKLISERTVCRETLKTSLLDWWKISGNPPFKILGENLFLIEFNSKRDKARVLEGRPWIFEGNIFAVEDFDGQSSPSELTFTKISFWVRMFDLPLVCMGREVGKKLGETMGTVEEVDADLDGIGWGEYLRVRIQMDITKPLPRGRKIKLEGKVIWVTFKYEKLPKFCFHCGLIVHGREGCQKRPKS
jgi:hypothetical protein